MKPIHIHSADPTAGVLCAELARMGHRATWGQDVAADAKYIVEPHAAAGPAQADRLTVDLILAAVRNARDFDATTLRTPLFTVQVRLPAAPAEPAPAPQPVLRAPEPPAIRPQPVLDLQAAAGRSLGRLDRRTALVMMAYGDDDRRVAAVDLGLQGLRLLDPRPYILFAELVEPGCAPRYIPDWLRDLERAGEAQTVVIPLSPLNAGVWQKEPVHNILGELAVDRGAEVLVFHDPDCVPDRPDWCGAIADYLRVNPDHVLQPWSSYSDTSETTHQDVMSYSRALEDGQTDIRRAPGLAWAMTAETFSAAGGFNPFFAPGGGDCGWVFGISDEPRLSSQPLSWPWWREILQAQPKPHHEVHSLECTMTHHWHGPFAERSYFWRNRALCEVADSVLRELSIGRNGLLRLSDSPTGQAIRHVLRNKSRMTDQAGCLRVVQEARTIKEMHHE